MQYNEQRGQKYSRWGANEEILATDLNSVAAHFYQNLSDTIASVVEAIVGEAETGSKNVRVNGLTVSISSDDLAITAGMAVSYQGSYFAPATGTFAFQSSTAGQPFLVTLPDDDTISDFVTSEVISGMEIRGSVEVRPEVGLYAEASRDFIDPSTDVVSSSQFNTRGNFGAELRLRYGNPQNANSAAPGEEAGWVKIAELFIDNNGSQSIVDVDDWTSGSSNFLILGELLGTGLSLGDLPVASTSQRGIVERSTNSEFDADDTSRYASPEQINNAISSAVSASQTALENMINGLSLGIQLADIPNASTSVQGLVERATNTEFNNRDSNRYVTAAQVRGAIDDIVDGAPGALDTLNELAAALNDDSNVYDTLVALIGMKISLSDIPNSDTTTRGLIETVTNAEGVAGTDTQRALTSAAGRSHGDRRYVRLPSRLSRMNASLSNLITDLDGRLAAFTTGTILWSSGNIEVIITASSIIRNGLIFAIEVTDNGYYIYAEAIDSRQGDDNFVDADSVNRFEISGTSFLYQVKNLSNDSDYDTGTALNTTSSTIHYEIFV